MLEEQLRGMNEGPRHTVAPLEPEVQMKHRVVHLQRVAILLEASQHRLILQQPRCVPDGCVADHSISHSQAAAVGHDDRSCRGGVARACFNAFNSCAKAKIAAVLADASKQCFGNCLATPLRIRSTRFRSTLLHLRLAAAYCAAGLTI